MRPTQQAATHTSAASQPSLPQPSRAIDELRDITQTMGHACARFRLNRHAAAVGNEDACSELYTELERLYWADLATFFRSL